MRRVPGLLAAIGLLAVTFPATVAAGQPLRASEWQTGILCDLSSDAGFISVYVDVRDNGAVADVTIWAPEAVPFEDPPTIVTAEGSAVLDGSSLTANLELVLAADPEKSAGSARVSAELVPAGPEQDFGSRDLRDGNRWYRIQQTLQLLKAQGHLLLNLSNGTVGEVDLSPCGASTLATSYFSTNPNAYLTKGDQLFISCEWMTKDGPITLLAISDQFGSFSQVVIVQGEGALIGLTVPEHTATSYQAYYDLFDPATGETVGSATANAGLSPSGERINDHEWSPPHRFSVIGKGLTANGTLTITAQGSSQVLPMDAASCEAGDVQVQVMERIAHD